MGSRAHRDKGMTDYEYKYLSDLRNAISITNMRHLRNKINNN